MKNRKLLGHSSSAKETKAVRIQKEMSNLLTSRTSHHSAGKASHAILTIKFLKESTTAFLADPILIEQVLLNLIKNGLEATDESSLETLIVKLIIEDEHIRISVIDRGHGLADPDRLFEPFFSTESEGLGMGLNICRTIIESHHGRLWAENNPQGGTIFCFTLPCAEPDSENQPHPSEELSA